MARAQSAEPVLTATATRTVDAITIVYTLRNTDETATDAFDVLYTADKTGKTTLDYSLCYVSVGEGGTLTAGKYMVKQPEDGRKFETAETPFMKRLEPGDALTGSCVIPLPLKTRTPYDDSVNVAEETIAKGITLQIGYIRQDRVGRYAGPWKSDHRPSTGLYNVSYGNAIILQEFARVTGLLEKTD